MNTHTIPKIIHRMWLDIKDDNNKNYPLKYQSHLQTFNNLNPEFEVMFWNTSSINKIFDGYPKLKKYEKIWNGLPYHIQKCDLARYIILYLYGGIYIDLDFVCYKNLSPLCNNILLLVNEPSENNFYYNGKWNKKISNGFMGSSKKFNFWIELLDYIHDKTFPMKYDNVVSSVMETTGPIMLSKFFNNSIYSNIKLLSPCMIMPLISHNILSKDCGNNQKPIDKYYYKNIGNFTDTKWNEGTQWGASIDLTTNISSPTIINKKKSSSIIIIIVIMFAIFFIIIGLLPK